MDAMIALIVLVAVVVLAAVESNDAMGGSR